MVSILIVNYNNIEYTKNLINDLENQINKSYTIWIVDQNSDEINTKNILNDLKLKNNNISVFYNEVNVDLNRVWNWFYENNKSEYLCYLNNDISLTNNFIDDTIKILNNNSDVGIVIHATNNDKITHASNKLEFTILNPPQYQGWDFTIRRNLYSVIPDTLRIFGGDDLLFAHVVSNGGKIGMALSSPIIHYKEQTRKLIKNINEIQNSDVSNFWKEIRTKKLVQVQSTIHGEYSNKYPPKTIKLTQNKKCIYTALIGDYGKLMESTVGKLNDWDYICFTDNKDLKSDFWRIIYISNDSTAIVDNIKRARYFKTNYYDYLRSYDNLIWKDSSIEINCDLNLYLKNLDNNDIVLIKHPASKSIIEEFDAVDQQESDIMKSIIKKKYDEDGYKFDNGVISSEVLLFKNNNIIKKFFNDWWNEIKEFSHRDQLSANYVLWKNKDIRYSELSYSEVFGKLFIITSRASKRYDYE